MQRLTLESNNDQPDRFSKTNIMIAFLENGYLQIVIPYDHDHGYDIFKTLQQELAEAFNLTVDDPHLKNRGAVKIDIGSPTGYSFIFTSEVDAPINTHDVLNFLRNNYIFSNQWSWKSWSNTNDDIDFHLIFEKHALHILHKNLKYIQETRDFINRKSDLETDESQYQLDTDGLKKINEFENSKKISEFMKNYEDEKKRLQFFITTYLQYQSQISAYVTVLLFKQLIDSKLFSEDVIKEVLQEDIITSDNKTKTLGQEMFDADPFYFRKSPILRNKSFHSVNFKGSLFDNIIEWICKQFGSTLKTTPMLSTFFSHEYNAQQGIIESQYLLAIREKENGNKANAMEQFLNIALNTENNEYAAKACYEIARLHLEASKKNSHRCKIAEAVEWVKRGLLQDNGKNLNVALSNITFKESSKFLLACAKESPLITVSILENIRLHIPTGMNINIIFYDLLKDTPWSAQTAHQAIDAIAALIQSGYEIAGARSTIETISNYFSKFPSVCLEILNHPCLMRIIDSASYYKYTQHLLEYSAPSMLEIINNGGETTNLLAYITYAEKTNLEEIIEHQANTLKSRYKEIIQAIITRAETDPVYQNLLQTQILAKETFFSASVFEKKDETLVPSPRENRMQYI